MPSFPKAMFRAGGAEVIEGRNFTSRVASDEADLEQALADGWHETTGAAAAAEDAAKLAEQPEQGGDAEKPSRADLEAQAKKLGVEFSPKIGDAKLAERIAAKLAEQDA